MRSMMQARHGNKTLKQKHPPRRETEEKKQRRKAKLTLSLSHMPIRRFHIMLTYLVVAWPSFQTLDFCGTYRSPDLRTSLSGLDLGFVK